LRDSEKEEGRKNSGEERSKHLSQGRRSTRRVTKLGKNGKEEKSGKPVASQKRLQEEKGAETKKKRKKEGNPRMVREGKSKGES